MAGLTSPKLFPVLALVVAALLMAAPAGAATGGATADGSAAPDSLAAGGTTAVAAAGGAASTPTPTARATGGADPTAHATAKRPTAASRRAATKKAATKKATTKKAAAKRTSGTVSPRVLGDRLPLRKPMTGTDVAELQELLVAVGQKVDPDGSFGSDTALALRTWERGAGLPANSVLTAAELTALRAAAAAAPPAPATPPMTTDAATPPGSPATATINPDGTATAPAGAPAAVQAAIAAGNAIATLPYRYGGGHVSFTDTAYDCSGSVSYALHAASLLASPVDSTTLESFGAAGAGTWITIYANADHTFMVIAGIRFDTSGQAAAGTRWQPLTTRGYGGFVVRHPAGL